MSGWPRSPGVMAMSAWRGGSYIGATQWLTAIAQPPHLKAISPFITTSEYYEGWTYQGGAFQLGFTLFWTLLNLAPDTANRRDASDMADELMRVTDDMALQYDVLPLMNSQPLRDSGVADYYFDWIAHATNDDYWQQIAIKNFYDKIQVPAYNMGGWYDLFIGGTLENFVRMQQEGGSEAARRGQRLLIGPWSHGVFSGVFPEDHFGVDSSLGAIDFTQRQLNFFDLHLKGEQNAFADDPPVRIFVMGINEWRDENEWPLSRTQYENWYLHSDGAAGSDGGSLSPSGPSDEPVDHFLYDPRDPTPTVGGATFLHGLFTGVNSGPRDQRAAEARPDVLTYTSAPLAFDLEVTGPLRATLYAATTAADTDFVMRLCDVHPSGRSAIIAEGILRARFREGTDAERPITPGEVYAYDINLDATSMVFLAGHCVRVDVMSASFPRFDANTGTGNPLGQDDAAALQPALQTIFHDSQRPSHIVLPIIPAHG